jgi:hypothetical protein
MEREPEGEVFKANTYQLTIEIRKAIDESVSTTAQ